MPNILADGFGWLQQQLHTHAPTAITYRRGSEAVAITATVGETAYDADDGSGFMVRFVSRDYFVRPQDITFGGVVSLPVPGDLIEEQAGHLTHVYEVMEAPGRKHYDLSDPYGKLYRIHTKRRRVEPQ